MAAKNKGESVLAKCKGRGIPYFVLSARDECALNALLKYIEMLTITPGIRQDYTNEVLDIQKDFTEWRFTHITRLPD
jgi:hypothetical protein